MKKREPEVMYLRNTTGVPHIPGPFTDLGPPPPPRCGNKVTSHKHGPGRCEWPLGHQSECDPDIWRGVHDDDFDNMAK